MVKVAKPTAGQTVTLYSATEWATVVLRVCAIDNADTIKIYSIPNGETRDETQAVKMDLSANSPIDFSGISLDTGDKIDVYSVNGYTNFIAYITV